MFQKCFEIIYFISFNVHINIMKNAWERFYGFFNFKLKGKFYIYLTAKYTNI